ncbi:Spc98 family-domain-containing protein [Scleroderma yunnanense]
MTIVIEAGRKVVDGSYLQRFLDLGSLVRRLELFVHGLRNRKKRANTTVHAFAHGLSSILSFLRHQFSDGPLFKHHHMSHVWDFAGIWLHYAEGEEIVRSLASICCRSIDVSLESYPEFSTIPADLLTLIYRMLEQHVQLSSPRSVIALAAYLLTAASQPYLTNLCKSMVRDETGRFQSMNESLHFLDASAFFEGDGHEGTWQDDCLDMDSFPVFIPTDLADILPVARKSLKLLEVAQSNHFILCETPQEVSWLWTETEIRQAWSGIHRFESTPLQTNCSPLRGTDNCSSVLDDFKIFDLPPGSLGTGKVDDDSHLAVHKFLTTFPESLPTIVPNLHLLCDLVFSSLRNHAILLSTALLSVFLDQTSTLCIDAHLILLRSHLLLTSHNFKSRLAAALFSDEVELETSTHVMKTYRIPSYQPKLPIHRDPQTSRAIGLAPILAARDTWPPGGSDLSFILRTVIVDVQESLYPSRELDKVDQNGMRHVMDEAMFRLGFAVRDLPAGTGRERWLDPLSGALDFLYLDYKVPPSMEVLISQTVLSKYHRVFTFLLRLMRVEAAIRFAFRLIRPSSTPLFNTLSAPNKLLCQFRFAAHSFINALSTYIYDVAIGGNFDAFLSQIAACRGNIASDYPCGFRDIFDLSQTHSSVLDNILSACLLRSSQRNVGNILQSAMELVLQFCVLVSNLTDSRLEEYQATSALAALYASFRKKVATLVKVLSVLLEKQTKSLPRTDLLAVEVDRDHRIPPGGTESLQHFLSLLDLSNWWKCSD